MANSTPSGAFGLDVANAEIVDFAGMKVLAVERFDRIRTRDGRLLRRPQEDMCQALSVPPTLKYQSDGGPDNQAIMQLLKGSDTPEKDQAAFLKAQMIFWLLGATDGHAKNFSVFLTPGQRFRMTPLYDILTAQPSVDAGQVAPKKFRLAMSAGENNHYRIGDITPPHFLQTADRCDFDSRIIAEELEHLLDTARPEAERTIAEGPALPAELTASILGGIDARLQAVALWKKASVNGLNLAGLIGGSNS